MARHIDVELQKRLSTARYALPVVSALLVTAALFFLMTQMILPFGRSVPVALPATVGTLRLQAPTPRESPTDESMEVRPQLPELPRRPRVTAFDETTEPPEAQPRQRPIDWWAEIERRSVDHDDAYRRWRIAQGHDRYRSVMQGAPPAGIAPGIATSPTGRPAYRNAYGDLEMAINDNCVLQSNIVNDGSDFARHLPPSIVCTAKESRFELPEHLRRELRD